MIFYLVFTLIILQRLCELKVASKNERWMKEKGGYEVGEEHYSLMVLMHSAFFITLLLEVLILDKELTSFWPFLAILFLVTQAMRVWALLSLGKYWNTKIIVLPNTTIVKKGPYKYLRHPNYVIVIVEILLIPLLFQAYWTAAIFSILNAWMLSVRIPLEEKALMAETDYQEKFAKISRFSPIPLKKCND
ncbi:isoprenylcysteine carboxyl methyltransferase family protein [Bacillus sp. DJP31]|uniref:isoprenylcysteine carboxyl methyltransferase family protein n=1 Tax=Bacillus sp. DJP31 TaxID=3409789 RepID=UPI003BB6CBCA